MERGGGRRYRGRGKLIEEWVRIQKGIKMKRHEEKIEGRRDIQEEGCRGEGNKRGQR